MSNTFKPNMKRKINRVGTGTLTVSLPSKWATKYGLKQGDEVEVVEEGNSLKFSTNAEQTLKSATVKLHGSWRLKRRYVFNAYRFGYDELIVQFENLDDLKRVQQFIESLIGYEIVEQGKNYCKLRSIATPSYEEFNNILRKYFLTFLNMTEETYNALKAGEPDYLGNVALQDLTVNKLYLFLTRTLRKREEVTKIPAMFLYQLLGGIESIGDMYRDACRYYQDKHIKLGNQSLNLLLRVNRLLRAAYEFFYEFSIERAEFFFKEVEELEKEGIELLKKCRKEEIVFIHYILTIVHTTYNINSPLFAAHIQ